MLRRQSRAIHFPRSTSQLPEQSSSVVRSLKLGVEINCWPLSEGGSAEGVFNRRNLIAFVSVSLQETAFLFLPALIKTTPRWLLSITRRKFEGLQHLRATVVHDRKSSGWMFIYTPYKYGSLQNVLCILQRYRKLVYDKERQCICVRRCLSRRANELLHS